MSDTSVPEWDVFVSYTQADRAWAEWIAWLLEEDGYRVLIQAWDFVAGKNWVQGMQDGVRNAARTVALLSEEYLSSRYAAAEWQAAWQTDPDGRERKLLPVRVERCERPGLLGAVTGVDVFDVTEAEARALVRSMMTGAAESRVKPPVAPLFPGSRPSRTRAIPREPQFPGAMPRVWNVGARNPNFTGRTRDLTEMRRALSVGSTVTVAALHGMGGIGKSQLANEYAHAYATRYDVVWWIDAERPEQIRGQYAGLAEELDVKAADAESDTAMASLVEHVLRQVPGWLLVFDNADAVADLRTWLPAAPMPVGTPGHVVITTRRGEFKALGEVIDLDVIDQPDAVALMRARVPDLDQAAAGEIAEQLGRLPLALEVAAAYMDKMQLPASEYLDLITTRGALAHRDERLSALWKLSFDKIHDQHPAAGQLLEICAYLGPEPIPLDLFTSHPELLPEPLSSATGDELTFNDTLGAIIDYSLAKRLPTGLHLHRLVQSALRMRDGHQDRLRRRHASRSR